MSIRSLNPLVGTVALGTNSEATQFTKRGVFTLRGSKYQRNFSKFSWQYWDIMRYRMYRALNEYNEYWLAVYAHYALGILPVADVLIRDVWGLKQNQVKFRISGPSYTTEMNDYYESEQMNFNNNTGCWDSDPNGKEKAFYSFDQPKRYQSL